MTNTFRQSLLLAFTTKYLELFVQFGASVIVARLLTPDDIGLFSVAVVFIGLGQLIREMGVNRYVIQEQELTDERIRAAYTFNLALGWGVGLAVFFCANSVGEFYERTEITEVMQLLSFNFLLVPFGAITIAYLRREMQFNKLMVIQVVSAVVAAITVVVCAWYGEGYRSMVWSAIAGTVTTVLISQIYRPSRMPYLPGIRELGRVFKFCRYAGPESLINHASASSPDMIMGKVLGMEMVGLFSRAAGTISIFSRLIMSGLSGVLLPYFSNALRAGEDARTPYMHATACVTGLGWPFFAVLGILAGPLIELLYGSQWRESAVLAQVMCIGGFSLMLTVISQDALTGLGQIRTIFYINLIVGVAKVGIILIFVQFGLLVVVIALQAVPLLRLLLVNRAISLHLKVELKDMRIYMLKNFMVTVVTVTPALIGVAVWGGVLEYSIPLLFIISFASGLCWIAAVYLIKPPIHEEIVKALQKYVLNRNSSSN